MNKLTYAVAAFTLSVSGWVNAAGYGVVDLDRVVQQSTYLKQQNSSLEQSVKPQTAKLEQVGKELEALQAKAQSKGANVELINTQYQVKMKEFQTLQQDVQVKVQSAVENTNKTFEARVRQAAEQVRQESGVEAILVKSSTLASDPKIDLTDKMIQKVNSAK